MTDPWRVGCGSADITGEPWGNVAGLEEYDGQRIEDGHTMFGRWQLPAYLQEVTRVALDLQGDRPSASAGPPQLKPQKAAPPDEPDPSVVCTYLDRDGAAHPSGEVQVG